MRQRSTPSQLGQVALQDGAAQLAAAAAAGMAGRPSVPASSAQQCRDESALDETIAGRLAWFFIPLFDSRPALCHDIDSAEQEAVDADPGARFVAYWCKAEALCPTEDEDGWVSAKK
jgi:hypothetical protein